MRPQASALGCIYRAGHWTQASVALKPMALHAAPRIASDSLQELHDGILAIFWWGVSGRGEDLEWWGFPHTHSHMLIRSHFLIQEGTLIPLGIAVNTYSGKCLDMSWEWLGSTSDG